jgi:hypothetical protein
MELAKNMSFENGKATQKSLIALKRLKSGCALKSMTLELDH